MLLSLIISFVAGGLLLPILLLAIAFSIFSRPLRKIRTQPTLNTILAPPDKASKPKVPDANTTVAESAELEPGFFTVLQEYDPSSIQEPPTQFLTPNPNLADKRQTSFSVSHARENLSNYASGKEKKAASRRMGVYFVVLRVRHLMLYEDEDQLEPAHIFALDSYTVDVFGGEDLLREGELFVKRNSIRMRSRLNVAGGIHQAKELHFLTENCSYKEDFYHALIKLQSGSTGPSIASQPLQPLRFETEHMGRLIQLLHGPQTTVQTRWVNVLIGRLFLSLYKTGEVEQVVREKLTKKLKRVRTPSFLSAITIGRVSLGSSAPILTNPRLRELTLEGDMTIELDVAYVGNFQLEVATTASFDFGRRLGQRETSLMLTVACKSLRGHLLLRIKPPPSNRVWISFETDPQLELSIEPVVSTRLITFGPIVRAIEGRIRDVVRETLVFPNWDDIPFLDTSGKGTRGGLWKDYTTDQSTSIDPSVPMNSGAMDSSSTIILPQSASTTALPLSSDRHAISAADDSTMRLSDGVITPVKHAKTLPSNAATGSHISHLSAKLSPLLHTTLRKRHQPNTETAPPLPPRDGLSAASEASSSQTSLISTLEEL